MIRIDIPSGTARFTHSIAANSQTMKTVAPATDEYQTIPLPHRGEYILCAVLFQAAASSTKAPMTQGTGISLSAQTGRVRAEVLHSDQVAAVWRLTVAENSGSAGVTVRLRNTSSVYGCRAFLRLIRGSEKKTDRVSLPVPPDEQ